MSFNVYGIEDLMYLRSLPKEERERILARRDERERKAEQERNRNKVISKDPVVCMETLGFLWSPCRRVWENANGVLVQDCDVDEYLRVNFNRNNWVRPMHEVLRERGIL